MSRVCQVTGRRTRVGNSIARRGLAKPKGGIGLKTTGVTNIQKKRIWVPELNRWVKVKLSTKAMKTINAKGAYPVLVAAGVVAPLRTKKA